MAIAPPSDIVLDVANAASRADLETARAELRAKAGAAAARASGEVFAAPPRPSPTTRPDTPKNAPFQKFEAMVLQQFMQSLMPQDTETVYGEGLAGDMWKSFLANELGETLAANGGIGIADRMLPDYYKEGDKAVSLSGIDRSAAKVARDEQTNLSTALVERMSQASMHPLLGVERRDATGVTARKQS